MYSDQVLEAVVAASGHTQEDATAIIDKLIDLGYTIVSTEWVKRVRESTLSDMAAEDAKFDDNVLRTAML